MNLRNLIRLIGGLVVVVAIAATASATDAREHQPLFTLVQRAIDGHIVPRHAAFRSAADELEGSVGAFCAAPSDAGRADIVERFRAVAVAWAAVSPLRMGPAAEAGGHDRIAFWPDPRGVMDRQLRPVLASRDASLIEPGTLAKQSAALQGLPALEVLIADAASPIGADSEDGRYRCALAKAIAHNVAVLAAEQSDGWTRAGGWRDRMLRPGSDNDTYHSATEAAAEIAKSLLTGLQLMIEAEVKPVIEAAAKKKPVAGLPFRRLGLSAAYLNAGIAAAEAFYDATGLESYVPPEKDNARALVRSGLRAAREQSARAMARAEGAQQAEIYKPLAGLLSGVRRVIATDVVTAAEIPLGFNELDGD